MPPPAGKLKRWRMAKLKLTFLSKGGKLTPILTMKITYDTDPASYETMTTESLRRSFLVEDLFAAGQIVLRYWSNERSVIGSAVPKDAPLDLPCPKELAATYFAERREIGVMNIGGAGSVSVDGQTYSLAKLDCLYIGRGSKQVVFASAKAAEPAQFYIVSYPAHTAYPTTLATPALAEKSDLGSHADANQRTIHRYIHLAGIKSCQLVMGFTVLKTGSVWNTMPPHTHLRRNEIYLYFDLQPSGAVFHMMGRPEATRSIVVHDRKAVLSPSWSIHCGGGTSSYTFIWAMGGENQVFADMDAAPVPELR
jgi:4-deoxy-L-threo-5-hexosulose-uronate ketol-isomerase